MVAFFCLFISCVAWWTDCVRFFPGFKEGVARIVRTFGDKLLAFRFPPRTAQKLQPFLELCQL